MARKLYFLPLLLLTLCPAVHIAPLGFSLGRAGAISMDMLWSGSWAYEGNLTNRGDLRLRAHKPALTLRVQMVDKRPAPPSQGVEEGLSAFSGGLYHETTGSRLLWGILDEGGLPARIKNVWNRGMPYAEQHQGAVADLRTEPSTTKENAGYLWLGSPWVAVPRLGLARGFGSALLDAENQAAFDGGLEAQFGGKNTLRAESFYARNHLAAKTSAAWFSETPPLPERDQDIMAGSLYFNSPGFAAAADMAWSETFAYGKDLYGNLAFRIGDRPWRLSLAADAAGSRYVGSDGGATGAGFRAAARLERRGKRSSLFRTSATLRAAAVGEQFYKGSGQIYYRFQTAPPRSQRFFRPSRISAAISRDASKSSGSSDADNKADSIAALWGFTLWKIPLVFQGDLHGIYREAAGDYEFASAKMSAEASYSVKLFQFSVKQGYAINKKGEGQAETGFSASIRGKWGRLSLKTSVADSGREWDVGVSWRLQL
ncbi:MAG: hypothetical protein LBU16_00630 [Treponema sp.]|jgi:hypothetical protein|nr:hypothetical protein [Treponema sp.]